MSKKKAFIEEFQGKDRKVGRPMKLNKVTLDTQGEYAQLLFFGDIHWGSSECDTKRVKDMINWALKENCYVLGMGDMMEISLRDSVGYGVYQQKINPQAQVEAMIELLRPLADKGLLIGLHTGNHEERITKNTGIDVVKMMANILNVPYCGYSCFHILSVGKQKYTMYSTHGSSNSTQSYTKLNAAIKVGKFINTEIIAYGHTHELSTATRLMKEIDTRSRMIVEKKQYLVMTGSYLKWEGGYAQNKGLEPTKLGSPKAKLLSNTHDIHFSI